MKSIRMILAALAAALALAGNVHAQAAGNELADGEIRKVDKEQKKLTIKHGPLKNLDMPGMTMVFQVKDEAMLDQVQPGDKVRVAIDKVDGKFTVMQLEPVR